MNSDFPAAHSMDTCWFAVDRDGHLAVFDSGHEGAVPTGAVDGTGWDLPEVIALQAPQVFLATRKDADRHFVWVEPSAPFKRKKPDKKQPEGHWFWRLLVPGWTSSSANRPNDGLKPADDRTALSLLLLVRSSGVLERVDDDRYDYETYRLGQIINTPEGPLQAVLFNEITRKTHRLIHEAGACYACSSVWESGVAEVGLYRFEVQYCELWPYTRVARPENAMRIDEIPEELRAAAGQIQFNGFCFADVECVQPLEHLPCKVWNPDKAESYLASDMKTRRPLPPREA
jgi:hypothetical protein